MPNPKREKVDENKRYVIEEIPTQTTQVIKDTEKDEIYDLFTVMMRVLENQEEILKRQEELLNIAKEID